MSKWHKKPDRPHSNFRITTHGSRRHEVEEYRYGVWSMVGRYSRLSMARAALDRLELRHMRRIIYNEASNRSTAQ